MSRTASFGLTQLYAPPDGTDVLVHIVAVHGLGGDSFETREWQDRESQANLPSSTSSSTALEGQGLGAFQESANESATKPILWLRDMLPRVVPDARIFTFSYLSGAIKTNHVDEFMTDPSQNLLRLFLFKRRALNELHVPIIFIAHSLGGILLKKALSTSSLDHHRDENIARATRGIVFLGTPHRGFHSPQAATSILEVLSLSSSVNKSLAWALTSPSNLLSKLDDQFCSTRFIDDIEILSIYEELPTPGIGLMVDKNSATIGHERESVFPVHTSHQWLARFADEDDEIFPIIQFELPMWVNSISHPDPDMGGLASQYIGKVSRLAKPTPHTDTPTILSDHVTHSFWDPVHGSFRLSTGLVLGEPQVQGEPSVAKSQGTDKSSFDPDVSINSSDSESDDGLTLEGLEIHNRSQHIGAIIQNNIQTAMAPFMEEFTNKIIYEMDKIVEEYFASIVNPPRKGGKVPIAETLATGTTSTGSQSRTGFVNNTPTATTSSLSKKRRADEPDPEDENNKDPDDQSNQKKKKGNPPAKGGAPKLTYACHFYKRMPSTYHGPFGTSWHSCASAFNQVYRIKEHITKKVHKIPLCCPICYVEFKDQPAKDEHIQNNNQNPEHTQIPRPPLEGRISKREEDLLPKRRRSKEAATPESEHAYWFEIWDILFPGEPQPPDPYFVDLVTLTTNGETGPAYGRDLMEFVEYWRANHVEIARPIITATLGGANQPMQNALMETFLPMMSRVFDAVQRSFRESGQEQTLEMFEDFNFDTGTLEFLDPGKARERFWFGNQ